MNLIKFLFLIYCMTILSGCNKNDDDSSIISPENTIAVNISTDKAVYKPGDIVTFTADKDLPASTLIRYRQLDQTVSEVSYSARSWTWQAPSADFTGYLIDLYSSENGKEVVYGSVAVDVSSDWTNFPRYGFLSKFGQLTNGEMDNVISNLARYHINGLQFYDWTEKHHKPLAGTISSPSDDWLDIARRPTYKSTVQYYITKAKEAGMKTMSYNLCYGALNDATSDGVEESWYLYKDAAHTNKAVFDIGSFLKSPIYLTDPSNTGWQQYLAAGNTDMYSVFSFDGYHIDQLGNQGTLYNYNGATVNLASTFGPFVESMKTASPGKRLVFNSVNQFGQEGSIATSSVDFLYTEVWGPNDKYSDLAAIIKNNDTYSSNTKKTVLAAYMNYNKAENPGSFNTPSVLFTDAVIFAFGGAHLELGEHMLGKEYFPNSNLQIPEDLKSLLIKYYDFSVAYQNLLRAGGTFNNPSLTSINSSYSVNNWPPQQGKITIAGKLVEGRQIIHLFNFISNTTDWRDTDGAKTTPATIKDIKLSYTTSQTLSKIWIASPDADSGTARELSFQQSGNTVTFTVQSLLYWDMIVVEY